MNILMVHNYYRSASPSGENRSFEDEVALLRRYGHSVQTYTQRSDDAKAASLAAKSSLALRTVWSREDRKALGMLLDSVKPDLVHIQNTFPLISTSILSACEEHGIPVVQSLRNFRLLCVNGQLFRDGQICEKCLKLRVPWWGVVHGSYRNSHTLSAVVATSSILHRRRSSMIDRYVVASRFAMKTFETAGFPMGKFRLKPNFLLDDPGAGDQRFPRALFAGRLTREKGVDLLLEAWRRIPPDKDLKLVFAGDGELRAAVEKAAHLDDRISLLGQIERQELFSQMKQASFLVCPFRSYETFGKVAVEALACGLPVLAPDRGALPEVVASRQEGILFEPDSVADLTRKLVEMTHFATPQATRAARRSYELRFTPLIAYERTMEIYEELVEGRKADG